jgi:hypothetical protein
MSEVNAEQRARAKTAAANMAVTANDTAVVLGAAGAVVVVAGVASGVGALAGVGMGAALGVCSFGAWWVGNRYQRLANDPPREDFDEVDESNGQIVHGSSAPGGAWEFAASQLILADASSALVTSLERYDGALAAEQADAATRQAEAVRHNAQAAIDAIARIAELARVVNQDWEMARPSIDWSSVSLQQVRETYLSARGEDPATAPGEPLRSVLGNIDGLVETDFAELDLDLDPVMSLTEMPGEPSVLVSQEYLNELDGLSELLGSLVAEE